MSVGLLPWQFWKMTPAELNAYVIGSRTRNEWAMERAAWMVSHLMNISGKSIKKGKHVTPDKLLGKKPKPPRRD
jgi:hypothetical protein